MQITLDWNDLIQLEQIKTPHGQQKYHIGYLTKEELIACYSLPVKQNANTSDEIYKLKHDITNAEICYGLVIAENENDLDFSNDIHPFGPVEEFFNNHSEIQQFAPIDTIYNFCPRKVAMILAGLGQYGKNQLIYDFKFGFNIFIQIYPLNNNIINLPNKPEQNWDILPQCEGCRDCIDNCPAHAIHYDEKTKLAFVDDYACLNFYHFGNDKKIPSLKQIINKYCFKNPLPEEKLATINDQIEWQKIFGFKLNEHEFIYKDNNYKINYDSCNNCMRQARCGVPREYSQKCNAIDIIKKEGVYHYETQEC